MPTIVIALPATTLDLKIGLALILVPTFAANLWQNLAGGAFVTVTLALGVALAGHGLVPARLGMISAAAVLPARPYAAASPRNAFAGFSSAGCWSSASTWRGGRSFSVNRS